MRRSSLIFILFGLSLWSVAGFGQTIGELRIKLVDPSGAGVKAPVQITSEANRYTNTLSTGSDGTLDVQRLSFGLYQLQVNASGFAPVTETVEVHSAIPVQHTIELKLASVKESVTVQGQGTLIDPEQAGSVNQISSAEIQKRLTSLPGRSIQDLVNSQPGWLYEGNAVLHPRGSEYQTQFVVDGIPLTDNRSPSFGPEIGANDVDSMTIYTAGFPAEYGRKMGGVVELNTLRDPQARLPWTDRVDRAAATTVPDRLLRGNTRGARTCWALPLPVRSQTTT